jgi:hypothetical protein
VLHIDLNDQEAMGVTIFITAVIEIEWGALCLSDLCMAEMISCKLCELVSLTYSMGSN